MLRGLVAGALIALAGPAMAQFVDPTAFHVTDAAATGSGPVLLNGDTTFDVEDNDNSPHQIDSPLQVYLLEPTTQAAPMVSSALFQANILLPDTFAISSEPQWNTALDASFYKDYLGCGGGCDGSLNAGNVLAAEMSVGLEGTLFNVYLVSVNMRGGLGFNSDLDFEDLNGLFAQGTIVAPFALSGTTAYDTSWTNAGFVNTAAAGSVPEPSTWALMLVGFALMAWVSVRRHNRPQTWGFNALQLREGNPAPPVNRIV